MDNKKLLEEYANSQKDGFMTEELRKNLIYIVEAVMRKTQWKEKEMRDYIIGNAINFILNNWKDFERTKRFTALEYYAEMTKRSIALSFNEYPNYIRNTNRIKLIDKMLEKNK